MTTERMAYFAEKYLQFKIAYWRGIVEREPKNEIAKAILKDYQQSLQDLSGYTPVGNLTEEGHW